MGRARSKGPAVAADAGPVGGPRVGDDAATDPGGAGHPALPRAPRRFPTTAVCAAATPGDVVRAWSGLGYNGRAVRLHAAACAVERDFGGRFPRTVSELRRLPGVGPYTARAVMAFAFEADVAVVDTNVARTWARWSGRALRSAEVQACADAAVPAGE